MNRGRLVIVSSPSGAGKTTLCQRLLAEFSEKLSFSVSYTTRKPRPGEIEGKDYHFVDRADFDAMAARDEFAEWAHVHGNYYGTTCAAVDSALRHGRDMLFDIDYQGGRQLTAKYSADAVTVFILPPSLEVLEQRLRRRQSESEEAIQLRLANSLRELEEYPIYEFLIVNDELERAYDELRSVYLATRYKRDRRAALCESLIRAARAR